MRSTTLALLLMTVTSFATVQAAEPLRLDDTALDQVTAGARTYLSTASGSATAFALGGLTRSTTTLDLTTSLGSSSSRSSSSASATIGRFLLPN